jgi:hypothetical protein
MKKIVFTLIVVAMIATGCSKKEDTVQQPDVQVIDHIVLNGGGPGNEFDACDCAVTIHDSYLEFNDYTTGKPVYSRGPFVITQK